MSLKSQRQYNWPPSSDKPGKAFTYDLLLQLKRALENVYDDLSAPTAVNIVLWDGSGSMPSASGHPDGTLLVKYTP